MARRKRKSEKAKRNISRGLTNYWKKNKSSLLKNAAKVGAVGAGTVALALGTKKGAKYASAKLDSAIHSKMNKMSSAASSGTVRGTITGARRGLTQAGTDLVQDTSNVVKQTSKKIGTEAAKRNPTRVVKATRKAFNEGYHDTSSSKAREIGGRAAKFVNRFKTDSKKTKKFFGFASYLSEAEARIEFARKRRRGPKKGTRLGLKQK